MEFDWFDWLTLSVVLSLGVSSAVFIVVVAPSVSLLAFLVTCLLVTGKNALFSYFYNRMSPVPRTQKDVENTCRQETLWLRAATSIFVFMDVTMTMYLAYLAYDEMA